MVSGAGVVLYSWIVFSSDAPINILSAQHRWSLSMLKSSCFHVYSRRRSFSVTTVSTALYGLFPIVVTQLPCERADAQKLEIWRRYSIGRSLIPEVLRGMVCG
jgi:hypothetical protein